MEGGRRQGIERGSENGVFSGRMERKLGGNQVWKWKGTRGLGEIAFDRISRLEKEPSLPQLSANEISRDTICLFESLFPACTRSRAYARIRCKRLVQRTTDLIGFRTRFANSSVYRFNGSFSSISGKALERWICSSKPFLDRKYRIETRFHSFGLIEGFLRGRSTERWIEGPRL